MIIMTFIIFFNKNSLNYLIKSIFIFNLINFIKLMINLLVKLKIQQNCLC